MFHKKFRIKTSTAMKASERKKFRNLLETQYPALTSEDIASLLPAKSELNFSKALLHNGEIAKIYCCNNNPLFFEREEKLFPTVYVLWKFPNLLPVVATTPFVLEKLNNGADLMAPGITSNKEMLNEFENLCPNGICAVRLTGNKSPIAVGISTLSSTELLDENKKGKAVLIAHSYKDNLWLHGDQSHPPLISDDYVVSNEDEEALNVTSALPESVVVIDETMSNLNINDENNEEDTSQNANNNEVVDSTPNFSMDDILMQCFMLALKVNGKKIQLPVLSSTFYRTYILNNCPPSLTLDIKKTSYKKLSVFLKAMSADKLIEVKELSKGVESIVSIDVEHEKLKTFHVFPLFREHLKLQKVEKADEKIVSAIQENYKFPHISEVYAVSHLVKDFFELFKIRKGEALTADDVKTFLREYVKENSLQNENNPREVILNPLLANLVLKKGENRTCTTWQELNESVTSKMQNAFYITFDGENPVLKKGSIEPITVSVVKRTGNKKVTLVHNLENFGIDPEKLANRAQVAVAASTSLTPTPNGKGTQVLIQGSQLRYLYTLFTEEYKIPRKYVKGFENMVAKKK